MCACVCVCAHAHMETLLPLPQCASALAHMWDGYEYTVVLFYAGYRLFTYDNRAFFPSTPLSHFCFMAMELCINQSHPICMEISIWQLFSIQNKYTHVAESSLWGLFYINQTSQSQVFNEKYNKTPSTPPPHNSGLPPSNTSQWVPCQAGWE